jgi:hypothetical protein
MTERAEGSDGRRIVDARRLWIGGLTAGVVAAGVAVVGLLIARGILDVEVLVQKDGQLVNANTWWYAGAAFLAAIVATGLLQLLLLSAPQPFRIFGWIVGLAVTIAVLLPFVTDAELSSKVATSVLNLAIGLCISSIVGGVGRSAARVLDERPLPPQYNERSPPPQY